TPCLSNAVTARLRIEPQNDAAAPRSTPRRPTLRGGRRRCARRDRAKAFLSSPGRWKPEAESAPSASIQSRRATMKYPVRSARLARFMLLGVAFVAIPVAASQTQDNASRVRRGFALSPVPLDLNGK